MLNLRSWHPRTLLVFLQASERALVIPLQKILHAPLVGCGARRLQTAMDAFDHVVHFVGPDVLATCYGRKLVHGNGDVRHEAGEVHGAQGAALFSACSLSIRIKEQNAFADVSLYLSWLLYDPQGSALWKRLILFLIESVGLQSDAFLTLRKKLSGKNLQPYVADFHPRMSNLIGSRTAT